MTDVNRQNDSHEIRPEYEAPMLTELDAGETASGVVPGAPENSSYSS